MKARARVCQFCGRSFGTKSTAARYCSDSCRMAAYRRRKDSTTGKKDRAEAARKGTYTKTLHVSDLTCRQCGKTFRRDANSAGQTMYCSTACRQAAYRDRKKAAIIRQIEDQHYSAIFNRYYMKRTDRPGIYQREFLFGALYLQIRPGLGQTPTRYLAFARGTQQRWSRLFDNLESALAAIDHEIDRRMRSA